MARKHHVCWMIWVLGLLSLAPLRAQRLDNNVKAEIAYKAKDLLSLYEESLNAISNEMLLDQEIDIYIKNAYGATDNSSMQVFRDDLILISDDINPENTLPGNTDNAPNLEVKVYLGNLHTFYEKSDSASIQFANIQTGEIQQSAGRIIVNVYYEKKMINRYKNKPVAYAPTKRIAVVEATPAGNRWEARIINIRYLEPEEVFVPVEYRVSQDLILAKIQSQQAETRTQVSQDQYRNLISRADSLFKANNYELAKQFYEMAAFSGTNDRYPINQISKIESLSQQTQERYNNAYEKALEFKNIRDYQQSINFFEEARAIKPSETRLLDEIQALREKLSFVNRGLERNDDIQGVIQWYEAEIRLDGRNPDLYMGRGLSQEKAGRYPKAIEDFTEVIRLDPNYRSAYLHRGDIHAKTGSFDMAVADYARAMGLFSTDIALLIRLSDLYQSQNQLDKAAEQLTVALALAPTNFDLYMQRGELFFKQKDYQKAVLDYSQAINLQRDNPQPYFMRGQAYMEDRQVFNAAADFNEAQSKGLNSEGLAFIRQYFYRHVNQADQQMEQGNYDVAIERYTYAVLLDDSNAEVFFKRGKANYAAGDLSSAIEDYDKALALNPQLYLAYYQRGLANWEFDNISAALKDFNQTLEYDPEYYQAYGSLGDLFVSQENYPEARTHYQRALEINRSYSKAYFNLGKLDMLEKNYVFAIQNFNRAKIGMKDDPEVHYYLGLGYLNIGNGVKAEEALSEAIDKKSNHALAYLVKGDIYYLMGRSKNALEYYSQAVTFQPLLLDSAEVRIKLGYTLLQRGEAAQARRHFEAVQKQADHHPDMLFGIACCELAAGKVSEARDLMEQAFEYGLEYDEDKEFIVEECVRSRKDEDTIFKYLDRKPKRSR